MSDPTTGALLTALDDLAAAAFRAGLSGREQLTRFSVLRDAQQDMAALAAADPYRGGRHNRMVDTLAVARAERARTAPDPDAVERLQRHRAATMLTAAVMNQITTDTPGLLTTGPTGRPVAAGLPGSPLLDLGDPFTPTAGSLEVPAGWTSLPAGVLDPVEKTSIGGAHGQLGTIPTPWHLAGYMLNIARQVLDWSEDGRRRIEDFMGAVVNVTLEKALIADLLVDAGTPAADLDTAEATAGGAWGTAVDTLVVNPTDWPAVRRSYGGPQYVPFPTVCVTGSITAGTALLFPRSAVCLLVNDLTYGSAIEPAYLGDAIYFSREGLATSLRPDAVAAATITTP
jgi:hypothetical protein